MFFSANCRLNSQGLEQLLGSDVHKSVGLEQPMNIRILVAGEGGVGKSSLVNALVGMEVSKPNDDVASVTKEVETIFRAKNGVRVYVTDVPGLGNLDMKDDDILHEDLELSEDIDLFLFCLKMSNRFDRHSIEDIETITLKFGKDIWKKGLFVLTFANEIEEKEHFISKLTNWRSEIRKRIESIIDIEVAEKIPIVPAGFREPKLPDRPSWVSELWIQGVTRMGFKARYFMAVLNAERIGEEIVVKEFGEGMCENPEEQAVVTRDMSKEDGRYADPKHIQKMDLILSSLVIVIVSIARLM